MVAVLGAFVRQLRVFATFARWSKQNWPASECRTQPIGRRLGAAAASDAIRSRRGGWVVNEATRRAAASLRRAGASVCSEKSPDRPIDARIAFAPHEHRHVNHESGSVREAA
jgi:hypothetical protein